MIYENFFPSTRGVPIGFISSVWVSGPMEKIEIRPGEPEEPVFVDPFGLTLGKRLFACFFL